MPGLVRLKVLTVDSYAEIQKLHPLKIWIWYPKRHPKSSSCLDRSPNTKCAWRGKLSLFSARIFRSFCRGEDPIDLKPATPHERDPYSRTSSRTVHGLILNTFKDLWKNPYCPKFALTAQKFTLALDGLTSVRDRRGEIFIRGFWSRRLRVVYTYMHAPLLSRRVKINILNNMSSI